MLQNLFILLIVYFIENDAQGYPGIGPPWTNRLVPYTYQEDCKIYCKKFTECDKKLIKKAIKEVERFTCIKFQEYEYGDPGPNKHIIRLQKHNELTLNNTVQCTGGGSGEPNTERGQSRIVFQSRCLNEPDRLTLVTRAFAIAAGLNWVQKQRDRDEYVKVYKKNVDTNVFFLLLKWPVAVPNITAVEYDYHSILHLPPHAGTTNGKPTITRSDGRLLVGPKFGKTMRCSDYKNLRAFYNCGEFDDKQLKIKFGLFCAREKLEDTAHEVSYIARYIPENCD